MFERFRFLFSSKPEVSLQEVFKNEILNKVSEETDKLKRDFEVYLKEYEKLNYKDASILSMIYLQTQQQKSDIINNVNKFRDNYLFSGIMSLLVEDSLSPNPISNDVVDLASLNVQFDDELKVLQDIVDVDALISSIIEDLLAYGEYYVKVNSKKGGGVLSIEDSYDQAQFVSVYEGTKPSYFINTQENGVTTKIVPKEAIHFCYGFSKFRIKVENKQLSEYVRLGRPVLWGGFELLNYLDILTALIPAIYVQKVSSTSILSVQVPDATSPSDALKVAQRYESILNRFTEQTPDSKSFKDILNSIGRFKVIPVYSDRGDVRKMDPRWEDIIDIGILEDIRKSIMASVGIPYGFLFGEAGKNETLKVFSRYVRKLALIQRAVREGLTQLAMIHLVQKGFQPKTSDIVVKFTNQLISVEELDKLEFVDTLVNVLNTTVSNVSNISQNLGFSLKKKELGEFLKKYLSMVDLESVFDIESDADDTNKDFELPDEEELKINNFNERLLKRLHAKILDANKKR